MAVGLLFQWTHLRNPEIALMVPFVPKPGVVRKDVLAEGLSRGTCKEVPGKEHRKK